MNKGLTFTIAIVTAIAVNVAFVQQGFGQERRIYKTVDEDGNVVFTDTPPSEDAKPMDLPELTVIETDYPDAGKTAASASGEDADKPLSNRELRRMYRDFGIISPAHEETFWGTENRVTISWGSKTPFEPGLSARLVVDGESRDVAAQGNVTLRFDRGEHTASVSLLNEKGRTVINSGPVTFFVKQHSANFNRPSVSPN